MTHNNAPELAVLVGATGDFGRAITARLASAGLDIIAVGRSANALKTLAADFPSVRPCVADITDDSAISEISSMLDGPVRLACHGAGLSAPGGVLELAPAALAASVNIKAGGMMRLARAVDSKLTSGARLIGIAGHYGLEPTDYACAAGVANAALIALMRQLSIAYGPRGVTAHTIAPGPADTPRLHRIAELRAVSRAISAKEVLEEMKAESPMRQLIDPEQVAWAVTTLLAPEAVALSGSTLALDGGRRRGLP